MSPFVTLQLQDAPVVQAPDGSRVAVLPALKGGSMAHFSLKGGQCSQALCHRSVEEIWFVIKGFGQMWRRQEEHEDVVELCPGTALTLPLGVSFQFRATAGGLEAVAITLPPWPGPDEAMAVEGPWDPVLSGG